MTEPTESDRLHAIEKQNEICLEKKGLWKDAKDDLKQARQAYEAEMDILSDMITPPDEPLFTRPPDDAPTVMLDEGNWRDTPLTDLCLKPGQLKALAENNPSITTVGELAAWQKEKGEFWSKDVKGLGQGARDEIDEKMDVMWEKLQAEDGVEEEPECDPVDPDVPEDPNASDDIPFA